MKTWLVSGGGDRQDAQQKHGEAHGGGCSRRNAPPGKAAIADGDGEKVVGKGE